MPDDATTVDIFADLESNGRFVKDTPVGGMLHRRSVSYRELRQLDSVHVTVDGTRVSAHVDRVSPLNVKRGGRFRYSLAGVLVHWVDDVGGRAVRRLFGRSAHDDCHLDCDIAWVDDDCVDVDEVASTN